MVFGQVIIACSVESGIYIAITSGHFLNLVAILHNMPRRDGIVLSMRPKFL